MLITSWRGAAIGLTTAGLAMVVSACAGHGRHVAVVPGPMCVESGALSWDGVTGSSPRRLLVSLTTDRRSSDGWQREGEARLEQVLRLWNTTGIPVRLARVESREAAQIRVMILERLPADTADPANTYRAGLTQLSHDASGAIAGARVYVAEQTPRGVQYAVSDQVATLLHELGHALGLPHSQHPYAVMSARSVATSITPADVALARSVFAGRGCESVARLTAARE